MLGLALGPLRPGRTWAGLGLLVLGAPVGLAWLLLVAAGLLVGGATAVAGVGLVVLLATLLVARSVAGAERWVLNRVLGAGVPEPEPAPAAYGWPAAARVLLGHSATWRSLGWVLFRGVAGLLVLAGGLASAVALVALLVLPFQDGYLQWGDTWRSSAGRASLWALPVGLVGLLGCLHLARLLVAVHVRVAHVLLGPDPGEQVERLNREAGRRQERVRLARDLHDSIGHAMTLVVVQAEAAGAAVERDPAYTRAALHRIAAAGRTALGELDAALAALRDDAAPRRPERTLRDLPELLARARTAGLPVTLEQDDVGTVPAAVSAVAFRILQEACTNVLRHAGPAPTEVRVARAGDVLRIEVTNVMGRSVEARPRAAGTGIAGLRERVELLGGTLSAGFVPAGAVSAGTVSSGVVSTGSVSAGSVSAGSVSVGSGGWWTLEVSLPCGPGAGEVR